MAEYDIIVAGGGPSGLQFAREIAHASDYSVILLEQNKALSENDKSTGGTFHQVVEGYDIPDRVIMGSSPEVLFEGPNESGRLPIPNYVLDFPKFLEYLGEDSEQHGVDILTDTTVSGPITEDGSVVGVKAVRNGDTERLYGKVTVDATGPAGTLTHDLGMWDPDAAQRGIGKEYEVEGSFNCNSMVFKFDHRFAPGGYAWVFPGDDGIFKIGVCWVNDFYERHRPSEDGPIDDYLNQWIESDSRWSVDEIVDVHAGEVISDNSINQRVNDGIVAVGDSVSSINPLFGEGIRPGMESAEMAAEVVLKALKKGDTSQQTLSEYERRWNTEKGPKWKTQRMIGELLYDFDSDQQNKFVQNTGRLTDEQAMRLQRYDLTTTDLLSLYPFKMKDIPKIPTLLRHIW